MNFPKLALQLLFGKRLPITSGELRLPGPSQPITIRRDQYGIPYIEAQSEIDGWYALGFCQGQDRPFQMEMLYRVCRGTLSELIGEAGLPIDKLSRRIGFYRAAQGHFNLLDPEIAPMLKAFAQGANAGARLGSPKPAHGFALLRTEPSTWTAVDALASLNYIGFNLSAWSSKLARWKILLADGPEALKTLDPDYADWLPATRPVNVPSGKVINRLAEDLTKLTDILGLQGGSNNWAMQASRTSTGRALLANDPHLAPIIPAPWYLAQINTPELKVGGASFVGAPIIPSGHNEVAAWGVTAGLIDNIDLFLEEFGEDGQTVREGDTFVTCQTLKETYQVKGQEPVEEEIIITSRGPIVTDVFTGEFAAMSMRITWMAPRPTNGLIRFHHAKDFASFRAACKEINLASLNLVYADMHDQIGWQFVGEAPNRGEAWGTIPLPGWDAKFHWRAQNVPWDEIPHLSNPATGFVATANNKPVAGDEGPYLGRDFIEYRQTRIVELLAERHDWNLDATQAMQLDVFSVPWRELKEFVLAVPADTAEAHLALQLLSAWDGVASADSAPAAVFEYFGVSMIQRLAQAKAPHATAWALNQGFHPMVLTTFFGIRAISNLVRLLRSQPEGWFPQGWPAEIAAALAQAVRQLQADLGADPQTWAWGKVHHLVLAHPLGARSPLDKIFNRGPFPTGGDHNTIAQAGLEPRFGSNVTGLANLRAVHDVGNWDDNRFVICGGQSGNPYSSHYDDLLQIWLRGEAITMPWSEENVKAAAQQILRLIPVKA